MCRSAPMWPGIRLPLMTRDGSVPGLIEPGFRCRVLPWRRRTAAEAVAVHDALEAAALGGAGDLDQLAGGEDVDLDLGARRRRLAARGAKTRSTCGAASSPAFLAWPSSALVVRCGAPRAEAELHAAVAHLHDRGRGPPRSP